MLHFKLEFLEVSKYVYKTFCMYEKGFEPRIL